MREHRGHFGTLVPFLFACNSQPAPHKPQQEPATLLRGQSTRISTHVGLAGLGICKLPIRRDGSTVDWGASIVKSWQISEEGARAALDRFLAEGGGLSKYESERHLADASAVARISPYLRFGMLSSRTMYWASKAANAKDLAKTFWRRLVWRDLAYWQLLLFPQMTDEPIRAHYSGQKWNTDRTSIERWFQGKTGYPIVDAGMRELWATGWMTQNVRMVVAIFLVEYLNVNWIEGARWFHHTLVDADPAINPMMWQNAGKSGLDQWNFTMHPSEFGRRMDPTGDYTRRWCPELGSLPARFIHCPWEAPMRLQKHVPNGSYPDRCVKDLEQAALLSCSAIRDQRARRRDRNDDGGYDLIVLPKGSTLSHDGRLTRVFTKKDYRLPLKSRHGDDDRCTVGHGLSSEKRRPDDYGITLGDYIRGG
jgi:deoxyribodipyrimidine photolyase